LFKLAVHKMLKKKNSLPFLFPCAANFDRAAQGR